MATIHVDGKEYEVDGADNLLQACLSLGLDVPYFCWHPALGSVGACRQCAVKQYQNADDKRGRLVMSCRWQAPPSSHTGQSWGWLVICHSTTVLRNSFASSSSMEI